jgi:hypothetical protein
MSLLVFFVHFAHVGTLLNRILLSFLSPFNVADCTPYWSYAPHLLIS